MQKNNISWAGSFFAKFFFTESFIYMYRIRFRGPRFYCYVVIIHHTPNQPPPPKKNKKKTLSDSVGTEGWCRYVIQIKFTNPNKIFEIYKSFF